MTLYHKVRFHFRRYLRNVHWLHSIVTTSNHFPNNNVIQICIKIVKTTLFVGCFWVRNYHYTMTHPWKLTQKHFFDAEPACHADCEDPGPEPKCEEEKKALLIIKDEKCQCSEWTCIWRRWEIVNHAVWGKISESMNTQINKVGVLRVEGAACFRDFLIILTQH